LVVINQVRPIYVRFAIPSSQLALVLQYGSKGGLPVAAVPGGIAPASPSIDSLAAAATSNPIQDAPARPGGQMGGGSGGPPGGGGTSGGPAGGSGGGGFGPPVGPTASGGPSAGNGGSAGGRGSGRGKRGGGASATSAGSIAQQQGNSLGDRLMGKLS